MFLRMLFLTVVLLSLFHGSKGTNPDPSIVIVGSGPAGIAAATKLLKNNFTNIKILEGENKIGGRINSVEFGDAFVDLGAEYCHGEEGNIVYSMVKDLGILRNSNENVNFLYSNGDEIKETTQEKLLQFAQSLEATHLSPEYQNKCQNVGSIGECLNINLKSLVSKAENPKETEILKQSKEWVQSYLSSLDSPFDLNDLLLTSEYKICEGDLGLNWNGLGYKTILEIMMQKYPNKENQLPIDDKILLQKEVSKITNWNTAGKTTVTCKDGSTFEADYVIFTPSVGVLKAEHETLFRPALPEEKVIAIESIGFGAIMKIILHFPERWWHNDTNWVFIWTPEERQKLKEKKLEWLSIISGMSEAENNPKVVIGWYAGKYIPYIETLSDEAVLEGQKYMINTFLAPHYNVTLPDKILRTFWYSNPHFRGTYSHESLKGHSNGVGKFPEKLASPLLNEHGTPTVLFAGEATHEYFFSTVHGAIESGYREAQRIIELIGK